MHQSDSPVHLREPFPAFRRRGCRIGPCHRLTSGILGGFSGLEDYFDSRLSELIASTFFPSIRRIKISKKIFQVRKIHNDERPVAFEPE